MSENRTFAVVATAETGQLLGLATFTFTRRFASYASRRAKDIDHGYVREVVVHRHFAGRGIGTELLQHCKRRILARGVQSIYIDRHEENAPSAAIMRKAGFVEIDTFFDPRRATGSRRSTICRYALEGAA